jgi:hypothetical protein
MLEAHWNEFYLILSSGDPPLALQLLVVNTIFFIYFIVRRMRGAPEMRQEAAITVQAMLIFANLAVLFDDELFGNLNRYF